MLTQNWQSHLFDVLKACAAAFVVQVAILFLQDLQVWIPELLKYLALVGGGYSSIALIKQ